MYYNNLFFGMLMMVLFKNVVWVGMDNHHPIYIMHVREEGTAKKLSEEYGQEDDSQEISDFFRHYFPLLAQKSAFTKVEAKVR